MKRILRWTFLLTAMVAVVGCDRFGLSSYLNGDLLAGTSVTIDSPSFATLPVAPVPSITLTATVGDAPVKLERVEFYAGTKKIGEDATAPFELTITNVTGAYYDFTAKAIFERNLSKDSEPRRMEIDAFVARVSMGARVDMPEAEPANFFDDRGDLPAGYVRDLGDVFGDRGNGLSYGWSSASGTGYSGYNSNLPERRYLEYIKTGTNPISWSLGVPDGQYVVRAAAGRNSTKFREVTVDLTAEGQTLFNEVTTHEAFYRTNELVGLSVSDGALTIEQGATGSNKTNLYFVEVVTHGADYQPPSAPTDLTADMVQAMTLQLHWRASRDNTLVSYYRVFQDGNYIGQSTGGRFFVNGLNRDTAYDFSVSAVDVYGNESERSEVISARTSGSAYARTPRTSASITVDAVMDEAAWGSAVSYAVDNLENGDPSPPDSPADFSASFRVLWDATNLYLFVDVVDDVPLATEGHKIELYFDMGNERSLGYDLDDQQLAFELDSTESTDWDQNNDAVETILTTAAGHYATAIHATGWRFEAALPWNVIDLENEFTPATGARIGFEVHVSDGDSDSGRDHKYAWSEELFRGAWTTSQRFGTLVLEN
ncbi:MAG: sugar-binding protein [Spirochaetales bacterium]